MSAWCVVNRSGHLVLSTLASRRVASIHLMVGADAGWQNRWRWWKRNHDVQVIRVTVEPQT